jgi:hypothetical protein
MITKASRSEASGASLKGYIQASLEQLYDAFDDAHFFRPSSLEKVQIEWILKFEDGTIATIYDWKKGGKIPYSDEVVEWNIGGHSSEAVTLVRQALGISKFN